MTVENPTARPGSDAWNDDDRKLLAEISAMESALRNDPGNNVAKGYKRALEAALHIRATASEISKTWICRHGLGLYDDCDKCEPKETT